MGAIIVGVSIGNPRPFILIEIGIFLIAANSDNGPTSVIYNVLAIFSNAHSKWYKRYYEGGEPP